MKIMYLLLLYYLPTNLRRTYEYSVVTKAMRNE